LSPSVTSAGDKEMEGLEAAVRRCLLDPGVCQSTTCLEKLRKNKIIA